MLLLVQHAATISRNALGLTPRDYALDPETHDTLKVRRARIDSHRIDYRLTRREPMGSSPTKEVVCARVVRCPFIRRRKP